MAQNVDAGIRRIGWVDAARALGACAIVLLHVFVSTNLAQDLSRGRQVGYAIFGIALCRWAVPSFFMLSGHLVLDPERNQGWDRARAHARRMLLLIATFGTAFALMEEVWVRLAQGMDVGIGIVWVVVVDVLTMQTWDHLWFVYAMAVVYMLVPPIRWVRARFGELGFALLTAALFVVGLLVPTVMGGPAATGPISSLVWNVLAGSACLCVGGHLHRWSLGPSWVATGVGALIIMVVVSIAGIGSGVGDQGFVFLQNSCLACAYAVFVLLLIRYLVGDGPLEADGILAGLAQDSLGIYVIHPLWIHVGLMFVGLEAMVPFVYELTFASVVLAASVATTRLLRLLPFFEELL